MDGWRLRSASTRPRAASDRERLVRPCWYEYIVDKVTRLEKTSRVSCCLLYSREPAKLVRVPSSYLKSHTHTMYGWCAKWGVARCPPRRERTPGARTAARLASDTCSGWVTRRTCRHGGPKFLLARLSGPLNYVCYHECGCMLRSGGIGQGIRVPIFWIRRASINNRLSMGRRGITLSFGMCAGGAVKPHRQREYPARPSCRRP